MTWKVKNLRAIPITQNPNTRGSHLLTISLVFASISINTNLKAYRLYIIFMQPYSYSYRPPRNPIPYLFLVKRHQYVRSILKASLILDLGCSKYKITSNAISLDLDKTVKPDIQGSGLSLPFKNRAFDSVTALELVEHFNPQNQDRFLGEVKRVLKPGGQFIVSTPSISEATRKLHGLLWFLSHWIYARKDLGQHIGELTHSQLHSKLVKHGFRMLRHKSFTLFNYVVEVEKNG